VITRRGWEGILAALVAMLISFFFLHYLLILLSVVAFAFLAAEVVFFHFDTRFVTPSRFRVERTGGPARHIVGTDGRTEVVMRYIGASGFVAEVFDLLPDGLEVTGGNPRLRGWWGPGETRRLSTRFRASIRGSYRMGPTTIVLRSRLGLAERRVALPTEQPVQVVPENPVRKPGQLRRRIFTRVQGRLMLRARGYGTEFRSLRPYVFSDDIRHVAWRRSTIKQLIVREFEQESRQDMMLVLDVGPAMVAGELGHTALDRASEAATLITGYAQRSAEDRVGLLTYSGGVKQFLPPSRGPPHFRKLFENIGLVGPQPGPFDLSKALDEIGERLHHGAHVLVFSALDRPLDDLHRALARFKDHGHHLYLFVPDLSTFYPAPRDPALAEAVLWATEEDHRRLHRALAELRAEAVPVYTFDRRGATTKVITAYGQIRAWGVAAS
jgi:uncharacterized protein (DUF58 family)